MGIWKKRIMNTMQKCAAKMMVTAILAVPESLVNAMPLLLGLWIGRVKAVLCCGLHHFEALVVCQSAFRTRSKQSFRKYTVYGEFL